MEFCFSPLQVVWHWDCSRTMLSLLPPLQSCVKFTKALIHLFKENLLNVLYVPGTVMSARNKYISEPLEGHSGIRDTLPWFTWPWGWALTAILQQATGRCIKWNRCSRSSNLSGKEYVPLKGPQLASPIICVFLAQAPAKWSSKTQWQQKSQWSKISFLCGDTHQCWHISSFHRLLACKQETPRFSRISKISITTLEQ